MFLTALGAETRPRRAWYTLTSFLASQTASEYSVGVQPAIETQDLRKTYVEGLFRRKRQEALKGVSLRVERGEIFGLLGGNGAGKTTFIKALLGIVRRTGGDSELAGLSGGRPPRAASWSATCPRTCACRGI